MTTQFNIEEATIGDVHAAYAAGTLTAKALVTAYLERIESIDKSGPTLNAVISVNPKALEVAEALDAEYARTGAFKGPLHGHCQVGSPRRAVAAFRPWRMLPTRTAASATQPR